MDELKIENWNGYKIRFVENEPGDWWAILRDITYVLDLDAKEVKRRLDYDVVINHMVEYGNIKRKMLIVNEEGIYETIFASRKEEAKDFRRWVYKILKDLRKTSGLEGFEIFRMLDKEHQKDTMTKLRNELKEPTRLDFVKANTITNKAVSNMFGYPKMIPKADMSPDMLAKRQIVLEDTVNLMSIVDEFNINCSVSEKIYEKYH